MGVSRCFFNDTATTEIYTYGHTLSLHDALPISDGERTLAVSGARVDEGMRRIDVLCPADATAVAAPGSRFANDAAALRDERDRFLPLLDALPMPVWQRARDASLSFCNRAYAAAVDADAPAAALIDGREIAAGLVDPDGRELADRALRTGLPPAERHQIGTAARRGRGVGEAIHPWGAVTLNKHKD